MSPWKVFRLSIPIAFLCLLVAVPGAYITTTKPDSPLIFVPGLIVVIAVPAIFILGYKTLFKKFKRQRVIMRTFAQQNGWKFEGAQKVASSTMLPEGWGLLGKSSGQIYRIRGNLGSTAFDLYTIGGFVQTMLATQPQYTTTIGYRTAVRTHAPLSTQSLPDALHIVSDENWNYVLMAGNALTAAELQAMLQPILATTA
ncbi:MAG TPA: hypothetical protein VLH38_02385 [Patescibacteria group bacterium]|nr:hypothetical protein [Patescibacteria group bacterium]